MKNLTYCQAINDALIQEMDRDPSVFVYGIGVPDHKRVFGSTNSLLEKFGPQRCFDTPLSEDAMTGFALGAAINGLRPVHIHVRIDFLLLAMNQIANMLAGFRYSVRDKLKVPVVIRAIIGRGWGQAYQHSKSMCSVFAHIPGIKVVMPTTPADAKGLLITAIRDDDPVIFLEHRWLYFASGPVPEESYTIPFGEVNVLRKGQDLTIVTTSWMGVEALKAADVLNKKHNIQAEIIDPRTISPLNDKPIAESVRKTGHCIVADNDWLHCGISAEISARISHLCFGSLKSPIVRIGLPFTHCPSTRPLENCFYPGAVDIIRATETKLDLPPADLSEEDFFSHERKFRGPF